MKRSWNFLLCSLVLRQCISFLEPLLAKVCASSEAFHLVVHSCCVCSILCLVCLLPLAKNALHLPASIIGHCRCMNCTKSAKNAHTHMNRLLLDGSYYGWSTTTSFTLTGDGYKQAGLSMPVPCNHSSISTPLPFETLHMPWFIFLATTSDSA